jgi:myo-inositol-1(or 4)-monophosphatase
MAGKHFHGIPHACVSIALQQKTKEKTGLEYEDGYRTIIGVIYDPFTNEMWTATAGGKTRVNGRIVSVSGRNVLQESILAIGFSKTKGILRTMLPAFQKLVNRVRKVRIMGSAALSLAYVAGGRMDAFVERGVRLWDIAAGGFMVERAGGILIHETHIGRPSILYDSLHTGFIRKNQKTRLILVFYNNLAIA